LKEAADLVITLENQSLLVAEIYYFVPVCCVEIPGFEGCFMTEEHSDVQPPTSEVSPALFRV
jgi:hypothetical protein